MSEIRPLLDAMRDRPEQFVQDGNEVMKSIKTGVQYWVYSGTGYYGIFRRPRLFFSGWDQWRFNRAYRRWRRVMKKSHASEIAQIVAGEA